MWGLFQRNETASGNCRYSGKRSRVAFLDEPTSGIDPAGITQMLDLINQIAREHNMTIVMSSHQLSQVERICTHVGIMSKGKLITQGSISQLSKKAGGNKVNIEIQLAEVYNGYRQCDPGSEGRAES